MSTEDMTSVNCKREEAGSALCATSSSGVDTVFSIVLYHAPFFLRFHEVLSLPSVCKRWNDLVDCDKILSNSRYDHEWEAILELLNKNNCLHKCPGCDKRIYDDAVERCHCPIPMSETVEILREKFQMEEDDPRWDPAFASQALSLQARRLLNYHQNCLKVYYDRGNCPDFISSRFESLLESLDYPKESIAPVWCQLPTDVKNLLRTIFCKHMARKIVASVPSFETEMGFRWLEEELVEWATRALACLIAGCGFCCDGTGIVEGTSTEAQQLLGPHLANKMDLLDAERSLISEHQAQWLPLRDFASPGEHDSCSDKIGCFHDKSVSLSLAPLCPDDMDHTEDSEEEESDRDCDESADSDFAESGSVHRVAKKPKLSDAH